MDYQPAKLFISYKHLKAKSPDKLAEMMLQIQVKAKKPVNFTAPTYNQGVWNTWYLFDYSQALKPSEKNKVKGIK